MPNHFFVFALTITVRIVLREREHFLEIFKIQVEDINLLWVADGVPMYWWVHMS